MDSEFGDLNGYVNAAVEKGIVLKARRFRPNDHASRGEAFKVASVVAHSMVSGTASTGTSDMASTGTVSDSPAVPVVPTTPPVSVTPTVPVPEVVNVSIFNFAFGPTTVNVKAGTKVVWENNDAASHTVTFAAF